MQHATEVEPHMVAFGATLVAAFQTGRIGKTPGWLGGATDTGWATSIDGGMTWKHGFLPGLTQSQGTSTGPYDSVSDPVVAYDAKHGVWMIASLPVSNTVQDVPAVVVNRSTDGGFTWQNPVNVGPVGNPDKNWIVCDNWSSSPHFGNCYMQWDNDVTAEVLMSTSSDGGQTWGQATPMATTTYGIGGQPLAQPNGTVVVPLITTNNVLSAFVSTDGGASWTAPVTISPIQLHSVLGGLRASPLPSAAVDGAGNVWVVWQDCRYRDKCSSNDLVYSISSDGVHWSAIPARIPIDPVITTVDHFIPGIGIDPSTSGSGAHVAIHYYYYFQSNCSTATCELSVGYIASGNGGSTWNAPIPLAGPMQLSWLPDSNNGLMVGDYVATAFNNGVPHGVFAVAAQTNGTQFNEAIYTAQGMTAATQGSQFSSAGDKPLHHLSDPFDLEHLEPRARRAKRSAH